MTERSSPALEGTEYGLNVGQFIRDHRNHVVTAGFDGYGYCARRKDTEGRATGPTVTALTLDELAAKLSQQEKRTP